jgi:anti-sigma-K factor RskA
MHIRSTEPMAVRRSDARLRLAAEIDARADRRRGRWLRACHACYGVACLSVLATVGLAFALPMSPAVGAAFGLLVLSLLGAEIAADKAAR